MTYSEKLKDPRWQKKRLKVLKRDSWCCRICLDTDSTLHVHHLKYSGEPWQAKMKDLQTLCEDCHSNIKWLKEWNDCIIYKSEGRYYIIQAPKGFIFYNLQGKYLLDLFNSQIKAMHALSDPDYRNLEASMNHEKFI